MKVAWVNRSFLDYRVPVYAALDRLLGLNLTVIFSERHTPARVREKIRAVLGVRAVSLAGERVLLRRGAMSGDFANTRIEVSCQPGLYREIKSCAPDVVIGEGFFQWTVAALSYRLVTGTPLVVSYERTRHTERHSQWFRTAYRKAVGQAAAAVCCNGILSKDYLLRLGIQDCRIVTGAMAADSAALRRQCENFDDRSREALRRELCASRPVFLYVGSLVQRKGVAQLLAGWELLNRRRGHEHATLVVVGDGPERPVLEAVVRERAMNNVRFPGAVPYDDIARYYAMADVFVMPTLEDNWSLVVPEAMACGLPVICSVFNGCWPELVRVHENGVTFDPFNAENTADVLEYFVAFPGVIRPYGAASRRIEAEFSPEHAAQAIHSACSIAYNTGSRKTRP